MPTLNIPRILAQLKAERRRLNRAIAALEKLVYIAQKEKRPTRSGNAPRRRQPGNPPPLKDQRSKEQRGKLLLFRKPRKSVRSKSSQAEEA
jgi:hypothetical protein